MSRPILVFDSGVGGLSVLAEIRRLLPQHDYCYLIDNARLPYGELADDVLIAGCIDLVCSIAEKVDAAIVVIACNTASTLVLPVLRARLAVPVVGVVPAIKPAALLSKNKKIGLIATPGTIKRHYTQTLIEQFAPDCEVTLCGSSELVMMAENKILTGAVDCKQLKKVLAPIMAAKLDVLVLGCTHFPMVKDELQQILGAEVTLLDSGIAVAKRVATLLLSQHSTLNTSNPHMQALYTAEKINTGLALKLTSCDFSVIEKIATTH